MQLTLGEITLSDETDGLLITLPKCRHTFTVETLDGICSMDQHYERHPSSGKWLGLQSPMTSEAPPLCPNCRAAITAPRYGRVFKSADLNILEKNVIMAMSQSLSQIQRTTESLSITQIGERLIATASKITGSSADITSKKHRTTMRKARDQMLMKIDSSPVSGIMLNPGNQKFFNISIPVAERWNTAIRPLFDAYSHVCKVAATRSAHLNAWQSAFSAVYTSEMDSIVAHPDRAPQRPEEFAMRQGR